jgi:phage tail-like protein
MTTLVRPYDFLRDGRTGWSAAAADRVLVPDGALTLLPVPPPSLREPAARRGLGPDAPPRGLAVAGDRVFVADPARHVIWHWQPCCPAAPLATVGGLGSAPRRLDTPLGLAIGPRGDLVVAEAGNRRLQLFTLPDLALRRIVGPLPAGGPAAPADQAERWQPVDVVAGPAGTLLVADGAGRVWRLDRQGRPDPLYPGELPDGAVPEWLQVDEAGIAHVGIERSDEVLRLDRYGVLLPAAAPPVRPAALPASPIGLDRDVVVVTAPDPPSCRSQPLPTGLSVDAGGRLRLPEAAAVVVVRLLLGTDRPDVMGSWPVAGGAVDELLRAFAGGPRFGAGGGLLVDDDTLAAIVAFLTGTPPDEPCPPPRRLPLLAELRPWLPRVDDLVDLVRFVLGAAAADAQGRPVLAGPVAAELRRRVAAAIGRGPFLRRPASGARFARDGVVRLERLDAEHLGNPWHRVALELDIPERTSVRLFAFTSDVERPDVSASGLLASPETSPPWTAAPANAREWLVQSPPGRYLHFALVLRGPGDRTPAVERLYVYARRDSSIRYLPAVYQNDESTREVLDRLLSLLDTVFAEIETEIEEFPLRLDPGGAPAEFLPWLSSWFNLVVEPGWSVSQRRMILAEVVELYRWRGTARGLTRLLQLHTGFRGPLPRVVDHARNGASDHVTVLLPAAAARTEEQRQALERVIAANLPAHAGFSLRTVLPGARLGSATCLGSVIGLDTLLGGERVWRLPAPSTLGSAERADRMLPPDPADRQTGFRVGGNRITGGGACRPQGARPGPVGGSNERQR